MAISTDRTDKVSELIAGSSERRKAQAREPGLFFGQGVITVQV
jgi:hypothetical protein